MMQMLNPWLTLSFQAVRLGWATQSAMMDQFTRLAGGIAAIPHASHADRPRTPAPAAASSPPGADIVPEPEPAAALTTKQHAPPEVAQKAGKNRKKQARAGRRR
jgi:hypothetical protein